MISDGLGFASTTFLSTTSVTTYLVCHDSNWFAIGLYFETSHLSPVSLAKCVWQEYCQYILIKLVTPVLQTPVPPLQRAADVTPVFNQILMNEQEEEYDGPPLKEIPALIVWTLGGKTVYVEGSWDNWKSRYNNMIYLYIIYVILFKSDSNSLDCLNVLINLSRTVTSDCGEFDSEIVYLYMLQKSHAKIWERSFSFAGSPIRSLPIQICCRWRKEMSSWSSMWNWCNGQCC